MKFPVRKLWVGFCLLGIASAALAQMPADKLPALLKAASTAPKTVVKNGVLSAAQLHALQSQFQAVEEARRALVRSPGWAVSAQFIRPANQLRRLGLALPPAPPVNAAAVEKEVFRRQVAQMLYEEGVALGQLIGQKPRPQDAPDRLGWNFQKMFLASARHHDAMDVLLASDRPSLVWGTPNWDEVRVAPMEFPNASEEQLDDYDELIGALAGNEDRNLSDTLNTILNDTALSSADKQLLMGAIAEASELLSYDFVRLYMQIFNQIPVVHTPDGFQLPQGRALGRYAVAVQKMLIEKLRDEGVWTEQDFNRFADVSVFLPPDRAHAVLGAVTYLEPKAALWLLDNPLTDPLSKKLIDQTRQLRARQKERWPDGTILPKETAHHQFNRLRYERQKALRAYIGVLTARMEKAMERLEAAARAQQIMAAQAKNTAATPEERHERLAANIFISARIARIKTQIEQLKDTLAQTQEALDVIS